MPRKYPLELHYGAQHRGMERVKTGLTGFGGRVTIAAGSLTQVVSATQIESDSLVMLGVVATASGGFGSVVVTSINPGTGFVLGLASNTAQGANITVMWRLFGV